MQLGDISIDVVGIEGLNEDLIDGISFTVQDLFSLSDTAQVAFISEDEDALNAIMALTDLQDGDILDSLVAIANMLEIVSETLSKNCRFWMRIFPFSISPFLMRSAFLRTFFKLSTSCKTIRKADWMCSSPIGRCVRRRYRDD